MEGLDIFSLAISILALLGALISILISRHYSKASLIHSLHEIVLQKAKDCNQLFEKSQDFSLQSGYQITMESLVMDAISEVTISIQLLKHSLDEYHLGKKTEFFFLQYWIQLSTSLRIFIKSNGPIKHSKDSQIQLDNIRHVFKDFFKEY